MTKTLIEKEHAREAAYNEALHDVLYKMDLLIKSYDHIADSTKPQMRKLWLNRLGRDIFADIEFDTDYVWVHKDRVKKAPGRKK